MNHTTETNRKSARPGSLTVERYTQSEGWTVLDDRLPLPTSTDLTEDALTKLLTRWLELTRPSPGDYWTECDGVETELCSIFEA